jgi:hypothetical protein
MAQKDKREYVPNQISIQARLINLIVSILFIVGGGYGVLMHDLAVVLGGKSLTRQVYHLHDTAAIIMYIGLLLVSVCLVSEIIDHYDKRNNEHIYHKIATCTLFPGIALCITGFLMVANAW